MKNMNPIKNIQCLFVATLMACGTVLAHEGAKHEPQVNNIEPAVSTIASVSSTASVSSAASPSKKKKSTWGKDYFPNPTLITQDGEELEFFEDMVKDKVVSINFIFTSCVDSCPLETARMKKVQEILGERVGKDIFFYSISIDPVTDTPAVLKAYKKKFNISADWTFLTGDEMEIINLRKKLGLYADELEAGEEDLSEHNLNLIIGNQSTGRWMKRSPFEDPHILAAQLGDWLHNWKKTNVTSNDYANAPKLRKLDPGEKLFRTRCSSCHEFGKDGVGPDLLGVTQTRDPLWLARWLKEPDKMLAENDPLATSLFNQYKIAMPNMRLSEQDVEQIIQFMASESERLVNLID